MPNDVESDSSTEELDASNQKEERINNRQHWQSSPYLYRVFVYWTYMCVLGLFFTCCENWASYTGGLLVLLWF